MKQAKAILDLIELLKSRNLGFEDELKAERFLLQNNYYRLSGYWRKYQINPGKGDDNFENNITFEKIVAIYELDALLRNLLQKGLGIFEICFRSKFAYYMAHSEPNGQLLYLSQNSYDNKVSKNEKPEDLLISIKKELNRSREKCIVHYKNKNEDIPIWAVIEVLSFGMVSKMYSRWANKDVVKKVSREFNLFKDYKSARHIMRSLVNLRNLCAHQARIWNRELIFQVPNKKYLQKFGKSKESAEWRIISILMLLIDEINQNNNYSKETLKLCKENKEFYEGLIKPTL
jgi:abortive infection bacteriophage resistance protein